jgi:hypothetical protein
VRARSEYDEEVRQYEARRVQAMTQVEATGRSQIDQSVTHELEHAERISVSTLRDYLETIGARLELVVAVFDDDERRVPGHLGREPAA